MEINEVLENSEVAEKAVEEAAETAVECMAKTNNGGVPNVAVGFGAGVLAGVIICRYIVPWIERKIRSRKVYVTPVAVTVEEPPKAEETDQSVETSETDSGEENPEK